MTQNFGSYRFPSERFLIVAVIVFFFLCIIDLALTLTSGYLVLVHTLAPILALVSGIQTYRIYGRSKEGMIWFLFCIGMVFVSITSLLVSIPGVEASLDQLVIKAIGLVYYIIFFVLLILRIRTEAVDFTRKQIVFASIGTVLSAIFILYLGTLAPPPSLAVRVVLDAFFLIMAPMLFLSFILLQHLVAHHSPYFYVWLFFLLGVFILIPAGLSFWLTRYFGLESVFAGVLVYVLYIPTYLLLGLAATRQRKIVMGMFSGVM